MAFWKISPKSRMPYILSLLVPIFRALKKISVDVTELDVVVIGNIGVSESDSGVKRGVVESIKRFNGVVPFHLGINLGNNVLPHGLQTADFQKLDDFFSSSFSSSLFPIDFLTILGEHDHEGDIDKQIQYHYQKDQRFYLPGRNYVYGYESNDIEVTLSDGISIRFLCVDSTPLYESTLSSQFIENSVREREIDSN
ncbi:hypothetical protein RF11_04173 [Thelohanellus kitauei]|uniref:Calcineurin-like phosphoesterase domain-containing protein n=1 Tax=Thelohanellus kitauei TaxID=669202 RepID=A0A0C2JS05_THEKT|nr:hypothetical protein RF11_04173 [Thelohanellus kitauei]